MREGATIEHCFTCLKEQFWAQTFDGLTLGAIYALIALGYTLVYGVLRLINFAHSEIFMIGIFASLFAMDALGVGIADDPRTGLALAVTVIGVMAIAMAASGGVAVSASWSFNGRICKVARSSIDAPRLARMAVLKEPFRRLPEMPRRRGLRELSLMKLWR